MRSHEYQQWLQNHCPLIVLPDERMFVLWEPWSFDEDNKVKFLKLKTDMPVRKK
tara:strand:- start:386 stop:547 length:162 start_codon:yes stop_codon:yes gene_type:complete